MDSFERNNSETQPKKCCSEAEAEENEDQKDYEEVMQDMSHTPPDKTFIVWHGGWTHLRSPARSASAIRGASLRKQHKRPGLPVASLRQLRQSLICSVRPDLNSKSTEL